MDIVPVAHCEGPIAGFLGLGMNMFDYVPVDEIRIFDETREKGDSIGN